LCSCDQQNCDPIGLNDLPGYGLKMSGTNNFINLKNQHEASEAHIILVIPFIEFGKNGIDYFTYAATFTKILS
jgi:hypothetical protein